MRIPPALHFQCVESRIFPPSPEHPLGHSEFSAVYAGGSVRCTVSISPAEAEDLFDLMASHASQGGAPARQPSRVPPVPAPVPVPIDTLLNEDLNPPKAVGDPRVGGDDEPDPVSEPRPKASVTEVLPLGQPVPIDDLPEGIAPQESARKARPPRTLSMDDFGNPVFDDQEDLDPLLEEVRSL